MATCIVVNWNGGAMLRECLASLRAQNFADREIILVDNGSNDGSWEIAQRESAEVIVLREAENLGFAEANNRGHQVPYRLQQDAPCPPFFGEAAMLPAAASTRGGPGG